MTGPMSTSASARSSRLVTRTGRLVPVAWDEVDTVTAVMLEWPPRADNDPGRILLHPGHHGKA